MKESWKLKTQIWIQWGESDLDLFEKSMILTSLVDGGCGLFNGFPIPLRAGGGKVYIPLIFLAYNSGIS